MRSAATRVARAVLVLVLASACSVAPLAVPERSTSDPVDVPVATTRPDPAGTVTVSYPREPSRFLSLDQRDLAADDLAALWGLPLLRVDDAGQIRRGLVTDWTVVGSTADGWQVDLHLASGAWTDGTSVEPQDVVASLQARRDGDPARFGVIEEVEVIDGDTVAVRFPAPHAAWADLLVETGTVLPAEAWAGAETAYDEGVPVSGGWYAVTDQEAGLSVTFEAHSDDPLGAPGVERIEVLFTPRYETALGLIEDGTVDVLLGYLALNGVTRALEVDGVEAESPLGGTMASLQFRPDGALGGLDLAVRRRGVAETVDVGELVEGMLGPNGAVATTPWPEVAEPEEPSAGEVREDQQFSLLYPGDSEVLGFVARSIQRDLTARGMTLDLVAEPAPRYAEVLGEERDLALVIDRSSRRPSLGPWLDDLDLARQADMAAASSPEAGEALTAVAELARIAPLFRIGVLHAWRGVEGLRPSSWIGAGFWNAGEWRTSGD